MSPKTMKKIILTLIICAPLLSLTSQNNYKFGASIGITNFTTTTNVNNQNIEAEDAKGYLAIFSEIKLSKKVNLLPQVIWITETDNLIIPIQAEFKTKYINFLAGLQTEVVTTKLPEDFTNFTFSAVAGISYNYDKNLKFLLNYSHGLTDNYTGNLVDLETKTNTLSFGLLFNFTK